MKAFTIIVAVALAVFTLVILFFAIKSRKFFRTLLFNAFLGISILALIDLTSFFTGMHIPVNWCSVGGCGVFGVPAVCFFLILQIIV